MGVSKYDYRVEVGKEVICDGEALDVIAMAECTRKACNDGGSASSLERFITHLDPDMDHLTWVDGMHGAEDHAVEVEAEVEEEGDVGVAMAGNVAELDVALGVDGNGVAVVRITGLTHKTQSVAHGELVMNGEVESLRVEVSGNVCAEEADASGHESNV